jgi:hypothetical protein
MSVALDYCLNYDLVERHDRRLVKKRARALKGVCRVNRRFDANFESNPFRVSRPSLTGVAPRESGTPVFTSEWWSKLTLALLLWLFCGVAGAGLAAAQSVPSGTVELSGGSVAVGIGYTWGHGTLIFDGKSYRLKVQGLSIVQVGISQYTASGTVYGLTKLSDINGIYTAVSAGAAVAGGASATTMKNSNGVVIQWVANHQGLNLSLSAKGVSVHLE